MARAKKACPDCGAEVWDLAAHRLSKHGVEPEGLRHAAPAEEPGEPAPERAPAAPEASQEVAPRKPGLMDRIRSRRGRGRGGRQASATAERPPKRRTPNKRRIPLDTDISDIWAFGGRRLERTVHYPTGRMLQYQAPAAGVIFDKAVAGTLPDRMLFQVLARNRDKYEDLGFLLAGPLLTFSITATGMRIREAAEAGDQEVYNDLVGKLEMQKEMFTWVLSMMLPRLAEGAKLAREKKAAADKVISEAFPELGEEDPVEVLAAMLFTPPSFEEAQRNGKPDHASAPSRPEGAVPL
jgi:hypothetical protein